MILLIFPENFWALVIKYYNKIYKIKRHKHNGQPKNDKCHNHRLIKNNFVMLMLIYYIILKMSTTIVAVELKKSPIESPSSSSSSSSSPSSSQESSESSPLSMLTSSTQSANANTKNTENTSSRSGSDTSVDVLGGGTADDYADEDSNEYYDELPINKSAKGMFVGSPCEHTCDKRLHHVYCDPITKTCGCEKNYPVVVGKGKGCAKPKKLGEQCFYHQTCLYYDANSLCVQINHNAICQCSAGFHSVSHFKPTKRIFCTQDIENLTSDLPTLLGVTTGIAVLAGLICMVLHLFSKTKYPPSRHFGDAHFGPPMFSSDTGIPLTIQSGRPSSRSSQRSTGSIGSYGNISGRRSISGAPKGVIVSQSRQGSRRPSLASVHSTSSSVNSYGMRRLDQELQQKEMRQEMKKHLCRLQEQQQLQKIKPTIVIGDSIPYTLTKQIIPTPSPLTPNSTDELLPSVEEAIEECSPNLNQRKITNNYGTNRNYNQPCSSTDMLK